MRTTAAILTATLMLAACGAGDRQADALDNAAAQSDPAAAAVLSNRADALREQGSDASLSDAGSPTQTSLEEAGRAAAANPGNSARP